MHNFDQEIDEETFEVLATQYQEIIVQQMVDETNAKDPDELRKIRIAGLKAMMRATFLTNPSRRKRISKDCGTNVRRCSHRIHANHAV